MAAGKTEVMINGVETINLILRIYNTAELLTGFLNSTTSGI